ncbi:MAG: PilT/PilU family type 4a pilus ATPase [Rickettsiales bacterium]|nr:PilT/PilU family type 4a pilus ATPase [Rickettsiales bacterium]
MLVLDREKIMHYAKQYKLSDIHIHSDQPIAIRVNGEISIMSEDIISQADVESFVNEVLDESNAASYQENKDADAIIAIENLRFRINVYNTMTGPAMVMRKIETTIPKIESLGLPPSVIEVTKEKNGLVLITGPTGSGKSTSLAAIINRINETRPENIITIEDPIEFVHTSKRSLISQREVGKDASSFSRALRASLREDPDVILVGELRDLETISLSLTAAETGHLVFGTLHTNGAPNTINRILDVFPPSQQDQARSQLSQSLRVVVTQRLIKRVDKDSRVAAFEVMVNNTAVANLIRENKIFQISQAMETGKGSGMMTMQDSLNRLLQLGIISEEDATKD